MDSQNSGLGLFVALCCIGPIIWTVLVFLAGRWAKGLRVKEGISVLRNRKV